MTAYPDRRLFLIRSTAVVAGVALLPSSGRTTPQMMQEAIRRIVGEAALQPGRVTIDVPPLVENGNAVPVTVSVESAMTESDRVLAVHIVNEKNPQPQVVSAVLGPRVARARLSTRIKLADSQQIVAIAEMKDGSFWSGSADVIVTIAACVEDVN